MTTAAATAVVIGAGVLIAVHPWAHPPVLKPVGLTVGSDTMAASGTADTTELAWSGPATGPLPDEYEVFRGGSQVGTVRGTETRYTGEGLAPNTSYGFQVIAVRGGKQSPASATLTVHTPPLRPTGLTAKGATTSSLVIPGPGPAAGPPPGQYEILRDGAEGHHRSRLSSRVTRDTRPCPGHGLQLPGHRADRERAVPGLGRPVVPPYHEAAAVGRGAELERDGDRDGDRD